MRETERESETGINTESYPEFYSEMINSVKDCHFINGSKVSCHEVMCAEFWEIPEDY